jgi:aerobic carbon-monoxide dehydrogenase large subunit
MGSMVGAEVIRKEDPNLITGRGAYVDDLSLPGMAHLVFVRSTEAHARITAIDTSRAAAVPGVHGVWTGEQLTDVPDMPSFPGLERPCVARDVVRFVGEPVAVVVAQDRFIAADAAALVDVTYDPLPAVVDPEAAAASDAPRIFEHLDSNVVLELPFAVDLDEQLAGSKHRAHLKIRNQRLAAVPIEPIGCLVDWQPEGLVFRGTIQAPHPVKNVLCEQFGLPEQQVRVIAPDVGGGFGAKQSWYPEYTVAAHLSRLLGRPIKAIESRSEDLQSMTHGRAQIADLDIGFEDDGRITALRVDILQDSGGWPDKTGVALPSLTAFMSGGCYDIGNIAFRVRCVATTTTPVASYRGAGRPEGSYLIERAIDLVADRTGHDPIEVRRRNFIAPDAFPYATPFEGIVYDSGDYDKALDRLLELIDYDALRQEQDRAREEPDAPLVGIGFSTWVEMGGFGPSALFEGFGFIGGWESANVRVTPDGSVTIATGVSPHGQGSETVFAQIAADALDVPYESITVLHGDTGLMTEGIGTMGSRAVAVGGSAVQKASQKVRAKMLEAAAHVFEASPDDIELVDGRFQVRGSPDTTLSFGEVALAAYKPTKMPEDFDLGLQATVYQEPPNLTYPSGAHCCIVEIDRETGKVTIREYVAVDDCGTVINPLLAHGQVQGGVAQGIAQALYEEVRFSEEGQPVTGTLIDYKVPAAPDLPPYRTTFVETPTPTNPLGAKGLGEAGATAAPQAVANAVVDALSHLGVENLDMPFTPQKVWRALQDAS